MGKRFAILIGVAAAGVMALGAQTGAAASEGVVSYGTKLTIYKDYAELHGEVKSKVRKCTEGREVILFRKRPGPDRKLGATRSGPQWESHNWRVSVKGLKTNGSPVGRVYAKATPKVGDGFKCRAGYSRVVVDCPCHPEKKSTDPPARTRLRAQTALAGGEPVDSTPPDLQLSGPKKQNPQKDARLSVAVWTRPTTCDVIVQVSCGDEACTVRATGKLTNVKMDKLDPDGPYDIAPGEEAGTPGRSWGRGAAQAGPQGARRGRERQGEGHRQGDGCGRERGDREAHDHTRQVGTTGSRAWRLGTSQAPRFFGSRRPLLWTRSGTLHAIGHQRVPVALSKKSGAQPITGLATKNQPLAAGSSYGRGWFRTSDLSRVKRALSH